MANQGSTTAYKHLLHRDSIVLAGTPVGMTPLVVTKWIFLLLTLWFTRILRCAKGLVIAVRK